MSFKSFFFLVLHDIKVGPYRINSLQTIEQISNMHMKKLMSSAIEILEIFWGKKINQSKVCLNVQT